MAADGARVALADLNASQVAQVTDVIRAGGGLAIAVRLDVTAETDWQAAVARILAGWGRLEICVNCAGIAFSQPITELDHADWQRVLATNLDGVFLGTKHALRGMGDRGGGSGPVPRQR